jgi:hypothetical protein
MEKEIRFEIDELVCLIDDINADAVSKDKKIKFVEASVTTDDNSNLYQVAEVWAMEMSSSEETWRFDKFLWMDNRKPYKYGIALFYKI